MRLCLHKLLELRTRPLTATKGYQVLEDDMNMSLDEFATKFGRADGEPEYAPTTHTRPADY